MIANKRRPGRCVYCLRQVDTIEQEHVFPRSWYPDNTPQHLEKITVPSCTACNREFGKLESELLLRLGMCVGPEDAAAEGIGAKALRSIDPSKARSERDRRARQKKREQLLSEVQELATPPEGQLPGFGVRPHLRYDTYHIIPIPEEPLKRLGEKLVRGLMFFRSGLYIEGSRRIQIHILNENSGHEVRAMIHRSGSSGHRGLGLLIESAHVPDSQQDSLWRITIWGRLVLFATVAPGRFEGEVASGA